MSDWSSAPGTHGYLAVCLIHAAEDRILSERVRDDLAALGISGRTLQIRNAAAIAVQLGQIIGCEAYVVLVPSAAGLRDSVAEVMACAERQGGTVYWLPDAGRACPPGAVAFRLEKYDAALHQLKDALQRV